MSRSIIVVQAICVNFQRAATKLPCSSRGDQCWKKPPSGRVKINVDAAFHEDAGKGATGAVVLNTSGTFIAASCKTIPYVAKASLAEAISVKNGLRLAESLGYTKVQIEADALEEIKHALAMIEYGVKPLLRMRIALFSLV